jgi:histidine triad (HIT) family protein
MEDCIFCKIISGEIPSQKLYEDDKIYVFNDINPEAPIHFLVIPKEHIANVNELTEENSDILAHIFLQIKKLVKELGIDNSGYRVITNTGDDAGQTVHHMHFHVIGKKKLSIKLS